MSEPPAPPAARTALLYHYCRMQLPAVVLPFPRFLTHLGRTFQLFAAKSPAGLTWDAYLNQLYVLDWYLCCGCLENDNRAWEALFATRTGRSDVLLIDALRARAVRLYPRDEEKQEAAVTEFWSHLLVSETPGSVPVLARYDGQRPLAPWLIRVFQNWHVSQLRSHTGGQTLPEDDLALPLPDKGDVRWHDTFVSAARDWLATLSEQEVLLLGLRWRYRLSQRDISHLFGVHEGTISRQTDKLRDRCLDQIGKRLTAEGWTGDDVEGFILTELGSLLMDDPKLSADQLTAMMARRGKAIEAHQRQPTA
jgi:RNA polymerase sigma factor (sigma-70 family)